MAGPAFVWFNPAAAAAQLQAAGTVEGVGASAVSFVASATGTSQAAASGSCSVAFSASGTGTATHSGAGSISVSFDASAVATANAAAVGATAVTFSASGVPDSDTMVGSASFAFTAAAVGFTTWSHFLGMTATTEQAICDLIVALIQGDDNHDGITPTSGADVEFEVFREDGDFREWAAENIDACLRRFTVTCGPTEGAAVSDMSYEWRGLPVEIVVAYPDGMGGRFGSSNNRSRDHVMAEDQHAIEEMVGLRGYTNFTSGGLPLAAFDLASSSAPVREAGDGVTFLSFPYFYRFFREV